MNVLKMSTIAQKVQGQPMFRLMDRVSQLEKQGQDVIHLEIGEPDFETPSYIVDAACSALKNGHTHYVNSKGVLSLREAVCEVTEHLRGFKPDVEQVLVLPGANIGIYLTLQCVLNPGDDVLVPDPGFPSYYSAITVSGVNAIRVPLKEESGFRMQADMIREQITPKTKLLILNSPQNPTGAVLQEQDIREIMALAEEHDFYVLSDEVYSRMIYNDELKFHSPSFYDQCRERTFLLNGFSKAFAMTGWRLGVMIGPEMIMDKMGLLLQTMLSCVPPFVQYAGIEALQHDQQEITHMMKVYEQRRDILVDGLNQLPGVTCLNPDGAFYVFPSIRGTGMTSDEFFELALSHGVALLPGNQFGVYGEGYVRLCYANSVDHINEALSRLKKALEKRGVS